MTLPAILMLLAAIAGLALGLVGGAFRWCIDQAEHLRIEVFAFAHDQPAWGWLIAIAVTARAQARRGEDGDGMARAEAAA